MTYFIMMKVGSVNVELLTAFWYTAILSDGQQCNGTELRGFGRKAGLNVPEQNTTKPFPWIGCMIIGSR